ncbi:MAG TPA: cell division protein FtsA [Micropepsaceae bacterium]|jgi:cell division protein FtsA|nr:cell division protein FtsA [Micropepsaceae bacterium]
MGDTFRTRTNGKANGARTSHARSGLIAALDVGSSKIACIIGRAEQGGIQVLGSALHESLGIKSGAVTNLDLAERSIREAVGAAEQLADLRIQDVILAVQCGQPKSLVARAEGTPAGELVNDSHLRMLLGDAKRRCREDGYETIQAAPTGYVVDSARGVSDPRGMYCERLGVSVHAVAVRSGPLQNLRLAVERCHLTIARQLYAPYASGLATLTPDETSLGVTLIDIGAGCTSVAVFLEDVLVHVDSVPLGGANITADLAKMLSSPLSAAERIKTLYGSALGELDAAGDLIEVPLMGEEGASATDRVRRSVLTRIISARLEEIFGEVQTRLKKSGFDVAAGRRAVLTGGCTQLAGVRELAAQLLNKQVRIGRPQTFPGLPAATAGPAYATALGLLISGATSPPESNDPNPPQAEEKQRRGFVRWINDTLFG